MTDIDHEIIMKEMGPIAGIDRKNTMTEINHAQRRDWQGFTKMIIKESIIIHFRTMEIRENIKIVIKTSIGMKISMIVIDLMAWIILMVVTGHIIDRLQEYSRDVYKKENHKYKRRSRDYYEDAYEDRHGRNK